MPISRWSWLTLLAVALFAMVGCGGKRGARYPSDSDAEAMTFFKNHAADFEKLRSLIEAHPFIYLHGARQESFPADAFDASPEVKAELLQWMDQLKLESINGVESDWGIRLTFLSEGMAMGGHTKSFFFSRSTPEKIVPSTEGFVPDTTESSSVFRKIEDNWYLQFEWGG